jgi:hypothetical protein
VVLAPVLPPAFAHLHATGVWMHSPGRQSSSVPESSRGCVSGGLVGDTRCVSLAAGTAVPTLVEVRKRLVVVAASMTAPCRPSFRAFQAVAAEDYGSCASAPAKFRFGRLPDTPLATQTSTSTVPIVASPPSASGVTNTTIAAPGVPA